MFNILRKINLFSSYFLDIAKKYGIACLLLQTSFNTCNTNFFFNSERILIVYLNNGSCDCHQVAPLAPRTKDDLHMTSVTSAPRPSDFEQNRPEQGSFSKRILITFIYATNSKTSIIKGNGD